MKNCASKTVISNTRKRVMIANDIHNEQITPCNSFVKIPHKYDAPTRKKQRITIKNTTSLLKPQFLIKYIHAQKFLSNKPLSSIMLLERSNVCSGVASFVIKANASFCEKSAFNPRLSRYSSSILNDFRITWSTRSNASCCNRMWLARSFVNHVLYSKALIIGTKSLKTAMWVKRRPKRRLWKPEVIYLWPK